MVAIVTTCIDEIIVLFTRSGYLRWNFVLYKVGFGESFGVNIANMFSHASRNHQVHDKGAAEEKQYAVGLQDYYRIDSVFHHHRGLHCWYCSSIHFEASFGINTRR